MKFNRLLVLSRANDKYTKGGYKRIMWHCKCDCGNELDIDGISLKSGHTKSCGCYNVEVHRLSPPNILHNQSKTRMYGIWNNINTRCYNLKSKKYSRYGDRGIKMCDEWRHNFENFYNWAMLNGYSESLTIDRIDNDKGYYPENCRWVDYETQENNKSTTKYITYKGETKPLKMWCKELNLNYSTISTRLCRGWDVDDAFSVKIRERQDIYG